ncbi:MAG: hypothetical protein GXP58_03145 [Deltaproteobacteria bacterium]|nr:hypothetical protein [Deltaproteobacteria bacterium]
MGKRMFWKKGLILLTGVLMAGAVLFPRPVFARGFFSGDTDTEELIRVLKEKGLLTDQEVARIRTRIEHGRKAASLKIQGRIQARYTSIEDHAGTTAQDANGFRLQRVRLIFRGNVVPRLGYFIHLNFDQGTDGHVWDTYLQYDFGPGIGHVRIGQFKVPFGRQWLTSSTKFLFMNRSNIGDNLGFRRDIGIMFERHSAYNQGAFARENMKEPVWNYSVGIFNGNHRANGNGFLSGSDSSARIGKGNDNDQYLYVGRLTWTPVKGDRGLKRVSLGLSAGYQRSPTNGDKFVLDDSKKAAFDVSSGEPWKFSDYEAAWGADGQVIIGPAIIQAEYIRRKLKTDDLLTFADGDRARSVTADGWYLQGGYYVIPGKLSLNARYETYDPNRAVTSRNDYSRYALGFNYYIRKNRFKLQGDYTWQDEAVEDLSNNFWELQLQALF